MKARGPGSGSRPEPRAGRRGSPAQFDEPKWMRTTDAAQICPFSMDSVNSTNGAGRSGRVGETEFRLEGAHVTHGPAHDVARRQRARRFQLNVCGRRPEDPPRVVRAELADEHGGDRPVRLQADLDFSGAAVAGPVIPYDRFGEAEEPGREGAGGGHGIVVPGGTGRERPHGGGHVGGGRLGIRRRRCARRPTHGGRRRARPSGLLDLVLGQKHHGHEHAEDRGPGRAPL